jgi:hypothetical protein
MTFLEPTNDGKDLYVPLSLIASHNTSTSSHKHNYNVNQHIDSIIRRPDNITASLTRCHRYCSVTMPSIEVGTIGGGTTLPAQAAMLELLGITPLQRLVTPCNALVTLLYYPSNNLDRNDPKKCAFLLSL